MAYRVNHGCRVRLQCRELFQHGGRAPDDQGEATELILVAGDQYSTPLTQHIADSLIGATLGTSFRLSLPPDLTFGPYQQTLLKEIARERIPEGAKEGAIISCKVKIGEHFEDREATLVQFSDDRAMVDFNHPLAGKTLEVEITVLEILAESHSDEKH